MYLAHVRSEGRGEPSADESTSNVRASGVIPIHLLILGLSSIVTRRVLPALKAMTGIHRIDVATAKAADRAIRDSWVHGDIWEDYSKALDSSSAQLVYVSVVNSDHDRWVHAALERGFHVVVDKPSFLGCDRAMQMVELAASQGKCLAEATVFGYHPQIRVAKQLFGEVGSGPTRISMMLSFPPLDPDNFRYQQSLGGGALWDVGPYLAATSRLFFGVEPETANCNIVARGVTGVDIAFSAMATFPGGRSLIGHFGFDTAYCNQLQLIGESITVQIDRAFTTPPDHANTVRVTGPKEQRIVNVPAADAFFHFFEQVIARMGAGDWRDLTNDLIADSATLDRYRAAAGVI